MIPTEIYFHVVIILLLLLVLWKLYRVEKLTMDTSGSYLGHGLTDSGVYTSGATLRRLGQIFTSTDQGSPNTAYNANTKALIAAMRGD